MKRPRAASATGGRHARFIGIAFGLVGFAVAALTLGEARQAAPFADLSARLMAREPFRPDVLAAFQDKADHLERGGGCSIAALRGIVLLRAILAETALIAGAPEAGSQLERLRLSAASLLRCSPTQGFGWHALYWSELNRVGPSPRALSHLAMSYDTAPREAWIAAMRHEAATRVLAQTSPRTQAAILDEWRDLLKAGLYNDAARILTQANPARRDMLVAATAGLDPAVLKWLPAHLNRLGLTIELPGISDGPGQERDRYRPFRY